MIKYDYTVTVTGNTAKLDKDIYLFRGNKNVHYYFAIKNASFNFKGTTDLIEKTNAINAAVTVVKPNAVEVANAIAEVENGKIHLKVTEDLIDEEVEVGDFDLVFDLFDDTDGAVTIPKVIGQFHVLERPCTTPISELVATNTTNEVDQALTDYAITTYAEPVASTNEDGTFAKKTWVPKEKITTAELNRMEEGISDVSSQCKDIVKQIESGHIGSNVEPLDDDLPNVYITGTLPTSKGQGDLPITIHYISKTLDFKNYGTLKVQGASSAGYPKKNFTLKLYNDKELTTKVKREFKQWGKLNKFVLKAHWMDCSHVRNVGTAKIWGKIAKSRSDYDTLPEEFKKSPNAGATDGFTVRVFVNGIYQGLYEWIVPKDKLFGQDSDNPNHSIATTELNNQPSCAFATTTPTLANNWSEELQDTMSTATSNSLTNFIKFVAGSSDADFIANAENYFDVQSVIDYDIFARIFCIVDNLCRNQIFFTYDGTKWYEGVWDLDAVLGLPPTTRGFYTYNTEFQNGYVAYADYKITNMLYKRVETLFMSRFKARYNELRADILSIEGILHVYEKLTNVIKTYDGLLAEDYASTTGEGKFTGIPYQKENNIQQIRTFISKRLIYMDDIINKMAQTVPCTAISLNKTTLTFTSKDTQTLIATLTPTNTTDAVTWSVNPAGICMVNNGVITPIKDGNCTITATCGSKNATCNVTVSGVQATKPCTAISLNNNKLTFTNATAQTLTATITPIDTTDTVIWSVNPTGIATVNNGVVTPKKNGVCVVTATCGTKSATCNVSISGLSEISDYTTDGLFADYDLRQLQSNATTVEDLSGNNNAFEIKSGKIQKDSKNGLIFDSNTIPSIENRAFNPNTNVATLEYMMKYTGKNNISDKIGSFNNRTMGICGENGNGFYMWLSSYGYNIFKNNNKVAETELTEKLIKGNYYHVVVTFSTTEAKLYINGKLINTHLFDSTIYGNANGAICTYFIGTASAGNVPGNEVLYSTRFYTKVLTEEEITNNYNYELAKLNTTER